MLWAGSHTVALPSRWFDLSRSSEHLLLCAFRSEGRNWKMPSHKSLFSITAIVLCLSFSGSAAEKKSKDAKADEASNPSYEMAQPPTENLDYTLYQRIRGERLSASPVMEFASGLMDAIGPRLTGSPSLQCADEWTRD